MRAHVLRKARAPVPGFSLLELLVAVAIAGMLASLAWPSYRDSLMRARRADGINAALAVQLAQEKFRGSCAHYAQTLGTGALCGSNAGASAVKAPTASAQAHYTLSIHGGSASATGYTIVATPVGIQAEDRDCAPLTLRVDAANPQGAKAPAGCW